MLKRFCSDSDSCKAVNTPLASHLKLSSSHYPSSEKDKKDMSKVPYASTVGGLMYTMVCTRPDITHIVGAVSRFLLNPEKEHWTTVKWILRYLKHIFKYFLCFGINELVLVGYNDSDMVCDVDSRKSTSWQSRLQKCVALSSTDALSLLKRVNNSYS